MSTSFFFYARDDLQFYIVVTPSQTPAALDRDRCCDFDTAAKSIRSACGGRYTSSLIAAGKL